jgi:hypothetical protein
MSRHRGRVLPEVNGFGIISADITAKRKEICVKRLLLFVTCALMWGASASAQTCIGALPFEKAQTRIRGDALFETDVHVFGVGLSQGIGDNLFAGGGLLLQTFTGGGDTDKGFYVSGGGEWALDSEKKFTVCPVATVARVSFSGGSNTMFNFGGNVGFEAFSSGNARIVPSGGVSFSRESIGVDEFGSSATNYLNIHAAVGLVVNQLLSVVPQIVIPLSSDVVDNSFLLTVVVRVGGH